MTVRYIGKCNDCKKHAARDYVDFRNVNVGTGMYRRSTKQFGRHIGVNWISAKEDSFCPNCNKFGWNGKPVKGVITDHVCDARCTEAKGFLCECACGGKNHGAGLLVCETA